jgi:hypothetical protein
MTLRVITLLACAAPFALTGCDSRDDGNGPLSEPPQEELTSDSITGLPLAELRQRLTVGDISPSVSLALFLSASSGSTTAVRN